MISEELNTKWDKGELTTPKYIRALNEYAMSLEAKIAKLEAPKTCEGCTNYNTNYSGCYKCLWQIQQDGSVKEDYYEPKDNS